MKVYLLGTAGYHPNETRHTACSFIPEAGVVLDAGTGFFRVHKLVRGPSLHVFLSHAHLDHCVGLSYFIDVIHRGDVRDFFVYGEPGKLETVRRNLFTELLFPLEPDFRWTPLDDKAITLPCGGRVRAFPLDHPGGSTGFRIDWPERSLAYVTDTTADPSAAYVRQIAGVDLLLHECHFTDGNEELARTTGHSCLTPVAEVCRAADVGHAVLIHINPACDDPQPLDLASVASIFDRITIGADRQVVEF